MNTVTIANFNENSKRYLDLISKNNEDIIILKNKKPLFKISPINKIPKTNLLKDSILFEDDIISPIDEKWEVD